MTRMAPSREPGGRPDYPQMGERLRGPRGPHAG